MKISKQNILAGRIGNRIMDAINCSAEKAKEFVPAVLALIEQGYGQPEAICKVLNDEGYNSVRVDHC